MRSDVNRCHSPITLLIECRPFQCNRLFSRLSLQSACVIFIALRWSSVNGKKVIKSNLPPALAARSEERRVGKGCSGGGGGGKWRRWPVGRTRMDAEVAEKGGLRMQDLHEQG